MGVIYLASLIVGLGIIAVQLVMFGDGGDVDAHLDAEGPQLSGPQATHGLGASFDSADVAVGHGAGKADIVDGAGVGFAALFLSLRFWTFGLMAFGLLGCFLHYFGLASAPVTALTALAMGAFSGWLAAYTFLVLARSSANSGASSAELVGQVGKVILPANAVGRAKVRLRVRGQIIDYIATTDGQLALGASVLVEEVRGEQVHVSAAPAGLSYEE